MQVDEELPNKQDVADECNDEMMKTTISSEDKEKEGSSPTNHAERIQRLHK